LLDLSTLERLGQGRAAEVFGLDEARVLKVLRTHLSDVLDREAVAMRAAHSAGLPVPNAYEILDVGGRPGLLMDRIRGIDMLTRLGRRPWTIIGAGRLLGRLHARIHEIAAPGALPRLKEFLEEKLRGSDRVSPGVRDCALSLLSGLADGDRLCHLDFNPANVMIVGRELVVIDWPNAVRGDPLADVAMTMLTLKGGEVPPGTSLVTRILTPIGRAVLRRGYWNGYRNQRRIDKQAFERWCAVCAAYRLTYGIVGEERMLMRVVEEYG